MNRVSAVFTADGSIALPDTPVLVTGVAVKSGGDTAVSVALTDYKGRTIATFASANYTTRTLRAIGPVETNIFDTGGDASADLEHTPVGVLCDGPIAVAFGGTLGSADMQVDIIYRPVTKTTVTLTTAETTLVTPIADGLPVHRVLGMALTSSSDTTAGVTVTDANAKTIATWASADYTTRTLRHLAEVETAVYDTSGDPSADTEGNEVGVFAEGALSLASSGLGAGTMTAEIYSV